MHFQVGKNSFKNQKIFTRGKNFTLTFQIYGSLEAQIVP